MSLKKNIKDIYLKLINDEALMRLLHYKADHLDDDVLEITNDRPLISSMEIESLWKLRDRHVVTSSIYGSLDKEEICRILIYPAGRRSSGNYFVANQDVAIEVLTHYSFRKDFRQESICDRLAGLLFNTNATGIGKIDGVSGDAINPNGLPPNFTGYRLLFRFGSSKGGAPNDLT
ncbi:hypothetical protein [Bacillus sp. Marseille-P3800]|uniref:hypothetical protein n=1 Tax=Bacillus sp. Marseille-P3800 TaxID=2014782 RepID=UPI000C074EF5|nr:hypothetical protein [Bacillus sp. Marseille-P3800]